MFRSLATASTEVSDLRLTLASLERELQTLGVASSHRDGDGDGDGDGYKRHPLSPNTKSTTACFAECLDDVKLNSVLSPLLPLLSQIEHISSSH